MIKQIQVINVRGIENKTFVFDDPQMHPNKVHLLIASNGFGKSSLTTAFDGLNASRLHLKEKDCHLQDESKKPELVVIHHNEGISTTLTANQTKNEISKIFNVFVIRGPRKVKASQRPTQSGFQVAVGEFVIDPIELCKIPDRTVILYEFRKTVDFFGGSKKAAPNISEHLKRASVVNAFLQSKFSDKVLGVKLETALGKILESVKSFSGTSDEILSKVEIEVWQDAESINGLGDLCSEFSDFNSKSKALLAAIQLIFVLRKDIAHTKKVAAWLSYEERRVRVVNLVSSCNPNPGWLSIEVKPLKGTLSIFLPKPEHMSNGQRDFLFFVAQLLEFEFRASKKKTILVIDEVFDYLDYGNVVACQYFLKKFIDFYSGLGGQIFPLVLTHLDPSIFNSFIFSKKIQKNHYLDKLDEINRDGGLCKIIRIRGEDSELETVFARFHAHHSLTECDEKELFSQKGLKTNWGCSRTFKKYCRNQIERYLREDDQEIDYLAVCLGLRIQIEKNACDQLPDLTIQEQFTNIKKTINKLDFAADNGVDVPELHYLLAGLYNSALHASSSNEDFLTPVVSKLRNLNIREMVREAFK